ncbi:MAG: phage integrase family protein [Aquabacterium sp.]
MLRSEAQNLGIHHFAFLRACLQGLDPRWAWDRYMAFSDPLSDLRHMEATRKRLMASVLRTGHQLNLTLPPERQITRLLNALSREPVVAPVQVLPTLDEFIALQELDPDMYSQAELLEIYQAHYATPQTESSNEQVQALNQLSSLLAVPPSPADPLSRWLDPRLADKLRQAGAIDIARLVDTIHTHGYRWYRRVPRLGETRAGRIVAWLISVQEFTGCVIREGALLAPQRQRVTQEVARQNVVAPAVFGIVPLAQLWVPSHLIGLNGLFRTGQPNTLGAHDDLEAVRAWVEKYRERPHTRRSYLKEVERFHLWCLHERKKPLSSIDARDCQAYRDFLSALPPSWINTSQARPGEAGWRPFRGPLEPSSQKLALVVVQTMLEGLRDAGYLAANPMAAVMKGFHLPAPRINLDRSFTAREWDGLMRAIEQEPVSPYTERLKLILTLLVSMGLRADELAQARLTDLRRVAVPGEEDAWILIVTGKRRKQREVPMPDAVVDQVHAHHRAFDALGAPPSPALLRSFGAVRRWVAGHHGPVLAEPETEGGLGAGGIYISLKRFFARAADRCTDPALDPERLRKASTHWLRHTFGRQAAADEVPVEVIQQALGHTSLATTTIYTTTERDRMIRALRQRKKR